MMNEKRYNFDVLFQKLSEIKKEKETVTPEELRENEEINNLRKIVLDITDPEEQSYSTT